MVVSLSLVSIVVYFISLLGILLNRNNLLLILVSIELCLLSINLQFILSSVFLDDVLGQVFSVFVLTVAAAETSIGLAILLLYHRIKGSIGIDVIQLLKG